VDIDDEEAVAAARAQQSRIEEIPDENATPPVTTLNNVSELSLYSRSVLSEVLLSTVVV
jgi:hypothetical protein